MKIIDIVDVDFANYRKPSMFIIFPFCSFKCDKENGCNLCQKSHLAQEPTHNISVRNLIERYLDNRITKAIVFGGLEPFDTPEELDRFIKILRWNYNNNDDVVIYTGYTEEELTANKYYEQILGYGNIVIKYGRFRPNQTPHHDEVLGVSLASDNQYAKRYNYVR